MKRDSNNQAPNWTQTSIGQSCNEDYLCKVQDKPMSRTIKEWVKTESKEVGIQVKTSQDQVQLRETESKPF